LNGIKALNQEGALRANAFQFSLLAESAYAIGQLVNRPMKQSRRIKHPHVVYDRRTYSMNSPLAHIFISKCFESAA
jgi:hypothetical protein